MSVEDEIKAIEERASKATPGPWMVDQEDQLKVGSRCVPGTNRISFMGDVYAEMSDSDTAAFIAAARTDVPRLVAALVEARRRLRETRSQLFRVMTRVEGEDGLLDEWNEEDDTAILSILRGDR